MTSDLIKKIRKRDTKGEDSLVKMDGDWRYTVINLGMPGISRTWKRPGRIFP